MKHSQFKVWTHRAEKLSKKMKYLSFHFGLTEQSHENDQFTHTHLVLPISAYCLTFRGSTSLLMP